MRPKPAVLGGRERVKVAVAQVSPAFLMPAESVERAEAAIVEAAANGADLVVFPEVWLAGYPYWTEGWDSEVGKWLEGRLEWNAAAVVVGEEETRRLAAAARDAETNVVMGMNELDPRPGCHTIYNTLLFLDREGNELGHVRKLNPTFSERMFWGTGDGRDLAVFDTDIGRIGGLVCGDNATTLTRAALIAQGEDIHVAAFPGSFVVHNGPRLEEPDTDGLFWGHFVAQSYSLEAGAFVICACGFLDPGDVPEAFVHSADMNIGYAQGGSAVYAPPGIPVAPPALGSQIVYAELEAVGIKAIKAIIDTLGHYSRPDVTRLLVRREGGWRPADDLRRAAERYGADEEVVEELVDEVAR